MRPTDWSVRRFQPDVPCAVGPPALHPDGGPWQIPEFLGYTSKALIKGRGLLCRCIANLPLQTAATHYPRMEKLAAPRRSECRPQLTREARTNLRSGSFNDITFRLRHICSSNRSRHVKSSLPKRFRRIVVAHVAPLIGRRWKKYSLPSLPRSGIEISLRRKSPKNGSFCGFGWRLSGYSR